MIGKPLVEITLTSTSNIVIGDSYTVIATLIDYHNAEYLSYDFINKYTNISDAKFNTLLLNAFPVLHNRKTVRTELINRIKIMLNHKLTYDEINDEDSLYKKEFKSKKFIYSDMDILIKNK